MSEASHIIRFGVFEVDLAAGELRRNGVRVKLQEQPFQVLAALLERPGEIVSKEDLQERIWKDDTFVDFDRSLATAVNKVRQALGDSATRPRFIETVPKRGYRFLAALLPLDETEAPPMKVQPPAARPTVQPLIWGLIGLGGLVVVALAVWSNRDGLESTGIQVYVPKPFTSDIGYEASPSFSPDGNQIVFAWDGPDHADFDLYIRMIGSSSRLRLTDTPENEYSPSWSPDGVSIAFSRETSPGRLGIFVMPAIGGPPRFVAEVATTLTFEGARTGGVRYPLFYPALSWTPDGAWLLTPDRDAPEDDFEQRLVSVETGEKRSLGGVVQGRSAAISPDGSTLAFVNRGGLFLVGLTESFDLETTPARLGDFTLEGLAAAVDLGRPAWTPDSRDVLVSGVTETEGGVLWRVPVDRSGAHPLLGLGDRIMQPTTSRVGRLAFVRQMSGHNIWRADISEPGGPAVRAAPLIVSTATDLNPEFSSDGAKITFQSNRSGYDEIWVCDSDGSNPLQVTRSGQSGVGSPVWSPDGEHIAFDGFAQQEKPPDTSGPYRAWEIFIVRSDGGEPRCLTFGGGNVSPAWSPDGEWIYYTQLRATSTRIYRISVTDGKRELLSENGLRVTLSPDGKWAYFRRSSPEAGVGEIWRVPAAGGKEELIVEAVNQVLFAVTNDGVYFVPPEPLDVPNTIAYLDLATRTTTLVYETRQTLGAWMDVSHDGRQLLFNQLVHEGSDIMLVEGTWR